MERKFSDRNLKMQRRSSIAQKKVADLLVEVIRDRQSSVLARFTEYSDDALAVRRRGERMVRSTG